MTQTEHLPSDQRRKKLALFSANGWTVITSELGFLPKNYPELTDTQRADVGKFLQALDDHDDVQRVWAALK